MSGEHADRVEREPAGLVDPPPASGAAVAIRDGRYSLVAYRDYEFPKILAKLTKKLHNINTSVMAEAPEWQ